MTNLELFNFIQFKTVMNISDVDEATYALILKAIFDDLEVQHSIIIDTLPSISSNLVFAIFRHAKFIFEVYKNNLDTIEGTSDSSGNKTTFKMDTPKDIVSTYRMYSPEPPAYL